MFCAMCMDLLIGLDWQLFAHMALRGHGCLSLGCPPPPPPPASFLLSLQGGRHTHLYFSRGPLLSEVANLTESCAGLWHPVHLPQLRDEPQAAG